jgi:hypothetical protein
VTSGIPRRVKLLVKCGDIQPFGKEVGPSRLLKRT